MRKSHHVPSLGFLTSQLEQTEVLVRVAGRVQGGNVCEALCLALRNALNPCKLGLLRVLYYQRGLARQPGKPESRSVWGGGAGGASRRAPRGRGAGPLVRKSISGTQVLCDPYYVK